MKSACAKKVCCVIMSSRNFRGFYAVQKDCCVWWNHIFFVPMFIDGLFNSTKPKSTFLSVSNSQYKAQPKVYMTLNEATKAILVVLWKQTIKKWRKISRDTWEQKQLCSRLETGQSHNINSEAWAWDKCANYCSLRSPCFQSANLCHKVWWKMWHLWKQKNQQGAQPHSVFN